MAIERTIRYSGKDVTILWKPHLCIHSRKCWQGLPEVFQPGERPWILPDGADAQRVKDQVDQCPSGALSLAEHHPNESTMNDRHTTVEVAPNGPLLVKGTVTVKHADGRVELKENQCALCRCGASGNKPFCDGSHRKTGFQG
jgi:uncharacterized Fe-S cluster protein YjdI